MRTQLAPGFLVASPALRCPFFHHTVVLLVDHDEQGSFGFVVNRLVDLGFSAVVEAIGLDVPSRDVPETAVMVGGPVAPESGFVLCAREPGRVPEEAIAIGDRLVMSASAQFLARVARGEGPSRRMLLLGYAGWGPGQLETEMREGSWLPVDLSVDLVFDEPVDARWRAALQKLGVDPAHFGRHVASA